MVVLSGGNPVNSTVGCLSYELTIHKTVSVAPYDRYCSVLRAWPDAKERVLIDSNGWFL